MGPKFSLHSLRLAKQAATTARAAALVLCGSLPLTAGAEPLEFVRINQARPVAAPAAAPRLGTATAFVVGPGLLVTNAHAIGGNVLLREPRSGAYVPAEVLAVDKVHDLALLRAAVTGPALALGERVVVVEGLRVCVAGFPRPELYGDEPKLSCGWVRSIAPDDTLTLELVAFGGNSGSPVLDPQGRVIGIVTGGVSTPLTVNGLQTNSNPVPVATRIQPLGALLKAAGVSESTTAVEAGNIGASVFELVLTSRPN